MSVSRKKILEADGLEIMTEKCKGLELFLLSFKMVEDWEHSCEFWGKLMSRKNVSWFYLQSPYLIRGVV